MRMIFAICTVEFIGGLAFVSAQAQADGAATMMAEASKPAKGQVAAMPAANWSEFHDPDGAFTVSVPAPVTTTKVLDAAADGGASFPRLQYMSTVDGGQSAAFVHVSDWRRLASANPVQLIENAVNGIKRYLRQVDSDAIVNQDGQQGREIRGTNPTGYHIVDRIFLMDFKLYQFMTSVPAAPSPSQSEIAARFLADFHLTAQAGPQPAAGQAVSVVCKSPALSANASFTYRLDYANFTVTTPAGATRPVTMSAQEITWDDNGPDGAVKNTLERFSGQLTQVKGTQTFTFACEPG